MGLQLLERFPVANISYNAAAQRHALPASQGSILALIPCAACAHQISELAVACPSCGHPVTQAKAEPKPASRSISGGGSSFGAGDTVTTQQTAKIYKFIQLVGVLMICAGPVACVSGSGATASLFGFGLMLWIGGRMGAWWANG